MENIASPSGQIIHEFSPQMDPNGGEKSGKWDPDYFREIWVGEPEVLGVVRMYLLH